MFVRGAERCWIREPGTDEISHGICEPCNAAWRAESLAFIKAQNQIDLTGGRDGLDAD